jgi:hypothetical protein
MKFVTAILGLVTAVSARVVETPAGIYLRGNATERAKRAKCPGRGFPVLNHLVGAFGAGNGRIVTDLYVEVDPFGPQAARFFCRKKEAALIFRKNSRRPGRYQRSIPSTSDAEETAWGATSIARDISGQW